MTTGDKLTLLAEMIRVAIKGATEAEFSDELSLTSRQAVKYLHFLRSKKLVVLVDDVAYFPSQRGLAYLATYDEAADLVDIDEPSGYYSATKRSLNNGIYWDKEEIGARMREIIEP
jgi:hypothetical protein